MKRLTARIICAILAVSLLMAAIAENPGSWTCPSCGSANAKAFCTNCGSRRPADWTCLVCGTVNGADAACRNCGNVAGAWSCGKCGTVNGSIRTACWQCGNGMEAEPTPAPTATPVPASMYAGVSTKAATYPWRFTEGRILNGVSSLEILNSVKGGNVISLIGWGYANHEEFNGRDCEIWLVIRDTAGNTKCFNVIRSTGLTGVEHRGAKNSRNLAMCDFSCVLDVSKFPDGEYQMGTAVRYVIGKNTRSFAYTFGDDYNFTVKNGIVTSIGGIENR